VLRFGAEWMLANAGEAQATPELDLGLRAAHSFGLLGLWFGLDARWRVLGLTLHARETLSAHEVSGTFSVGLSFVDWIRK
jgi:hypothetical protein